MYGRVGWWREEALWGDRRLYGSYLSTYIHDDDISILLVRNQISTYNNVIIGYRFAFQPIKIDILRRCRFMYHIQGMSHLQL